VTVFDRERIEAMLASDSYARSMGIELVAVEPDEIKLAMQVRDDHLNFLSVGHGGMVFSLADVAFSLASNAAGDRAVAIDTHLVLTAATRAGDRLTVTVREASRGRTLGTYRAEVKRGDNRVAALFTGTVHISQG
jgi:acyl-CoA thioesterase